MAGIVRTISTLMAIDGEKEYRASIANINASLGTLRSDLALVDSAFKGQANSTEALKAKQKLLTDSLDQQRAKVTECQKAYDNAKNASAKWAAESETLKQKLTTARSALESMKNSTGNTTKEQKALTAEIARYQRQLAEAEAGQVAASKGANNWAQKLNYSKVSLNDLDREVQANGKYLAEATMRTDHCATSIDRYGKEAKQAGDESKNFGDKSKHAVDALAGALVAAGATRLLREIAESIAACNKASMEFESAITGIYKTVEGTPEQLAAINDEVKRLALELPASTTEIAAVAESAGQLGIATEDVMAFSKVMLDLGNTTNLSAEAGASSLAKFANITKMSAADYERLGSTIVGLGNNFATTEADIVALGTRLASTGELTGLSEADIMGVATALSSLGIEAEAGGSAVSKLLRTFEVMVATESDALIDFAAVAGMSADEFSAKWGEDAVGALSAFIDGLGAVDTAGGSSVAVLDDLGIKEVRLSNAVLAMASSNGLLSEAVGMANTAWGENIALTKEAELRYGTAESKTQLLKNACSALQVEIGDVLRPAIAGVVEAGTDMATWATDMVKDHPELVSLLSAAAAAVVALTIAVTGYSVAIKIVKPLIDAFNTALAGNPIGLVVVAIGVLVAALGTFVATLPVTETQEFTNAIRDTREAFVELREEIEQTNANNGELVGSLLGLLDVETRTVAQRDEMAYLVDRLNESMPELNLQYDKENDKLSMTAVQLKKVADAEALRNLEKAEAPRRIELEKQRLELTEKMATAYKQMEAAEQMSLGARHEAMNTASEDYITYRDLLSDTDAEIRALRTSNAQLHVSLTEQAEAASGAGGAFEVTSEQVKALTEESDALAESSTNLTSAHETLTAALGEQEKNGALTLSTALDLIDTGYAAAISINEETGAITLNREAYINLAQAKMDAQIASLEAQQTSTNTAIAAKREAIAIKEAAISHFEYVVAARSAKAEAADADMNALKAQNAATDAQIAALKASKNALNSYTYVSTESARTTSSTTAKQKTQAEKDLDAFKSLKETLSYQRTMGEIDDAEFYQKLAEHRDAYLVDDGNVAERRKIDEEIYKYEQKLAKDTADVATKKAKETTEARKKATEDEKKASSESYAASKKWIDDEVFYNRISADEVVKAWERVANRKDLLPAEQALAAKELYTANQAVLDDYGHSLDDAFAEYEDKIGTMADGYKAELEKIKGTYDDLMAKQDAMSEKLSGYGDLFKITESGNMRLTDLDKTIDAMNEYDRVLTDLKENGISSDLLNEISGMGVDEATTYGKKLLKMADKDETEWKEYNETYDKKNRRAIEIAEKLYKDQIDPLTKMMDDTLKTALGELNSTSFTSGENVGQKLTDGMRSKLDEVKTAAQALADAAKLDLSGSQWLTDALGWDTRIDPTALAVDETRSIPTVRTMPAPRNTADEQTAAVVNAMSTLAAGSAQRGGGPTTIIVQLADGTELARALYDDFDAEGRRRG